MPTYQYACTNPECSHQFELVQSFADPAADSCPVCGAPVRKRYGSVGVVFKGSGFYRTDSRADSNGKHDRSDKAAAATSSGSGSGESAGSSGDSAAAPAAKEPAKPASTTGSGSGSSKVAATA